MKTPFLVCLLFLDLSCAYNGVAQFDDETSIQEKKYLIYDVNPGEGFNLRRDVYMRVANVVRQLREQGCNYILVLPPWGNLYHWRKRENKRKWSEFFDVESLNLFVPVMEFEDFIKEAGHQIDLVLYLQPYTEGWQDGEFELKFDIRPCIEAQHHYEKVGDKWRGMFFSYSEVWSHDMKCLSIQGQSSTLVDAIKKGFNETYRLMVDRSETILHDHFGDIHYWRARRSMRYSKAVIEMGDNFRREAFNSNDMDDRTVIQDNWQNTEKKHGDAIGGNYLCVHLRRRDFVRSHKKNIPSIEGAAKQISETAKRLKLNQLFLSTDADIVEIDELASLLLPSNITLTRFEGGSQLSDGFISVVDQVSIVYRVCRNGLIPTPIKTIFYGTS
uniref:GDP-fucose protein O-fucosyltransferase 2 n=1 Tax=Acrobeloides nanus TaxID=290746 RepID=A0A914CFM1_9BILA